MKNLLFAALAALTLSVVNLRSFAASPIADGRDATTLQQTSAYGGDSN